MEWLPRAIAELVVGIILILLTHTVTRNSVAKDFIEANSKLIRQLQTEEDKRKNAEAQLAKLRPEHKILQKQYAALKGRYEACSRPRGQISFQDSVDERWHQRTMMTGDGIEMKLTYSTVVFWLTRVSRDGAVFEIERCAYPAVQSGTRIPSVGERAYLAAPGRPLEVGLASECCQRGPEGCDPSVLEAVTIETEQTDLEQHSAQVRYRKLLEGFL